jgi:ABC-2 type transport system ATP-binding protein
LRDGAEIATTAAGWRAKIAYVFQSPAIDKRLTSRQNLELAARLQGLGGAAARSAVELGLSDARLGERADEAAATLSGGMLRRLDIARALIGNPELVLLDEPTTGVDEASFRDLWARLNRYRAERGAAMLLATHRSDEAEGCDRVATMRAGRVTRVASPQSLIGEIAEDAVRVELRDEFDARAVLSRWWSESATAKGRVIELRLAEAAHEIAPIIAAIGAERVTSVSVRRPTMADAFARATGGSLEEGA